MGANSVQVDVTGQRSRQHELRFPPPDSFAVRRRFPGGPFGMNLLVLIDKNSQTAASRQLTANSPSYWWRVIRKATPVWYTGSL